MTREQIEAVLNRVREWPLERQEDAARILMEMEEAGIEEYDLTEEQYAQLDQAIAEADRGEFATGEEVRAVFDRYRR
jgi:predicted transcriptional regulator